MLVHTRRPLHLIRTTGLLGFLGFVFFIGGTALSGLLNPIFWALYLVWLIALWNGFDPMFPQILLFLSLLNLLAGNGAFIYLSMLAPIHRGWLNLIPYSLTVFGYWVLMSVAAYRALWQLLRNPFYWEKTQHGALAPYSARASLRPEAAMSRALAASPVGLLAFVAALTLSAYAVRKGLMADDAVTLWASAISAGGGDVPIGRIIASYPTLPFFVATLLELVTPTGTPTPALLAAGVLAFLSGAWFLAFRAAGLPWLTAALATLLVALHPAMLAACLAGAAEMCLAAFLYLLGVALFDMRARTAAPEVMSCRPVPARSGILPSDRRRHRGRRPAARSPSRYDRRSWPIPRSNVVLGAGVSRPSSRSEPSPMCPGCSPARLELPGGADRKPGRLGRGCGQDHRVDRLARPRCDHRDGGAPAAGRADRARSCSDGSASACRWSPLPWCSTPPSFSRQCFLP